VIHSNTYGELLLRVILQRDLGESSTAPAALAQQWAGDRMSILQQGNSTTVIWMLAFSDASSAARFAMIYAPLLDRLHGSSTPHRVDNRGNAVLCVIGDALRQYPELPSKVWQQTAISTGVVAH
jgi:hypothetical protein